MTALDSETGTDRSRMPRPYVAARNPLKFRRHSRIHFTVVWARIGPSNQDRDRSITHNLALLALNTARARLLSRGFSSTAVSSARTDLSKRSTAAHIHCCTAAPGTGVAGVAATQPHLLDFPLGVASGTYDMTFNLTSASFYNPAFVAAEGGTAADGGIALARGLADGVAYFDINTLMLSRRRDPKFSGN
jgi:hypothetical protein